MDPTDRIGSDSTVQFLFRAPMDPKPSGYIVHDDWGNVFVDLGTTVPTNEQVGLEAAAEDARQAGLEARLPHSVRVAWKTLRGVARHAVYLFRTERLARAFEHGVSGDLPSREDEAVQEDRIAFIFAQNLRRVGLYGDRYLTPIVRSRCSPSTAIIKTRRPYSSGTCSSPSFSRWDSC